MRVMYPIALFCLIVGSSASSSFAQQDVKIIDKKFLAVGAALVVSSVYDVETTKLCVNAKLCREASPIMAPFINSSRPAAYGYLAGLNSGSLYFAYHLKGHKNPRIRRLWWVVPISQIVGHSLVGSFNLRFVL
mgnify:CR=1 FL=1